MFALLDRSSQAAALLPWLLSAVTFRYSPVVVWLNAGSSQDGGWDGSLSMTGMKYLDLRYAVFLGLLQITTAILY